MSDYFDRVERQIVRNVEAGLPRSSRRPSAFGYLATAAAVAVVIVVIVVAGVFLLARGSNRPAGSAAGTGPRDVTVTFKAKAIDPKAPVGPAAIDRSISILLERLTHAFPGTSVSWNGRDIVVVAPHAGTAARARILALAVPGRLRFYDWEADAITPNGKTVASQLQAQNPTALQISQGSESLAPGQTGAGSMPLRQALALASRLPRKGVVVEAVDPSGYSPANFANPHARFYVLRDDSVLTEAAITHPKQRTDASGSPDLQFGFTRTGGAVFKNMTKTVAVRGDQVSGPGRTLNQHFAIALDGRLLTVPYIDFKVYPDGIAPGNGADISGGFTVQSAQDLATILRYGPLPVTLTATG